MKWFSRKPVFPTVKTTAGLYGIPIAKNLADEHLCVQLAAPDLPDFDAIAMEIAATARSCPAFHHSSVCQLSNRLICEYDRYASEVDEAADRLKAEILLTYKTSIDASLETCEDRLEKTSRQQARRRGERR